MLKFNNKDIYPYVVIFCEGFATIATEILTMRQLMPIVGSDIFINSMIIAIFLLALAYGYARGGKYQTGYIKRIIINFMLASMLLGFGLSYVFIQSFFIFFTTKIYDSLILGLTAYLLLITAPLVYLLGQTIPITMNIYSGESKAGAIGGKVMFWNTIGSFLGSILTTTVLIHFCGVAVTVFIICCLLLLCSLLLSLKDNKQSAYLIGVICAIPAIYILNINIEKNSLLKSSPYANYQVYAKNDTKVLTINNSEASFLDSSYKSYPYIELIKFFLFKELKLTKKNILVLGAGGFTLSAENDWENNFTYVDIDKAIKSIVSENYLPNIKGEFVANDARAYLQKTKQKYDAIVFDAYSHRVSVPSHLVTREFFMKLRDTLTHDGVAVLNIIASPLMQDKYSMSIDATIRSVFPHSLAIPIKYGSNFSNIIYLCQNKQVAANNLLYTDNQSNFPIDKLLSYDKSYLSVYTKTSD